MQKKGLVIATAMVLVWASPVVATQNDEEAILAAVQQFFDAMASRDADRAREVLDPEGSFVSVRDGDSELVVRRSSFASFLEMLETTDTDLLERMWESKVMVHREIAAVWTPYDFHRDGKFSHCGVDLFQLVKRDEKWKITGGTYTVEPNGCADSPLGPPE